MNYKVLAEDAIEVAKNAKHTSVVTEFLQRAQVYATLELANQQRIGNLLRYSADFTEEAEFKAVGETVRGDLGL